MRRKAGSILFPTTTQHMLQVLENIVCSSREATAPETTKLLWYLKLKSTWRLKPSSHHLPFLITNLEHKTCSHSAIMYDFPAVSARIAIIDRLFFLPHYSASVRRLLRPREKPAINPPPSLLLFLLIEDKKEWIVSTVITSQWLPYLSSRDK